MSVLHLFLLCMCPRSFYVWFPMLPVSLSILHCTFGFLLRLFTEQNHEILGISNYMPHYADTDYLGVIVDRYKEASYTEYNS